MTIFTITATRSPLSITTINRQQSTAPTPQPSAQFPKGLGNSGWIIEEMPPTLVSIVEGAHLYYH